MMLKSFGCSFIFGTDLSDDGADGSWATPSQLTWPALLSQHLKYDYRSYAWPGSGNLQILEKLLSQSAVDQSSFYVVGWTWIDRFDYVTPIPPHPYSPNKVGLDYWNTLVPTACSSDAEVYYKNLHSQYQDKLTTLTYIKTAIDIFKQKNISFIMTYMDELIFETEWHTTPAVVDLQDYIRPYMTTFDGKNFLEFSKEKGFPISETLHPLETAHQAAFELIQPTFDAILRKV
jgi:hypothetical protein